MTDLDMLIPGEAVVYYATSASVAHDRGKKRSAAIAAADAAWAALRGEVDLLQRRRPDGTTDYLITRRRVADRSPVEPAMITQSKRRAAA